MKKITLLMLLLVCALLVLLTACGKTENTTDDGKDTTDPVTAVTTAAITTEVPATEETLGQLTVAGEPIASYQIVYAPSEYANLRYALQGTEYDFYHLTAKAIAEQIESLTGVTLAVVPQTRAESDHEILVGPTNRDASMALTGLGIYQYVNRVVGTKLVVGGGTELYETTGNLCRYYTYASTYHAFDAVAEKLTAELKLGDVNLEEGFDLSGERHFTTVACVGDSITEGVGSSNSNYAAYPAILQRLLWQDYVVVNFGNSGKTMRNDVGSNYTGTTQYNALIKFSENIDITLVMLGTNDSYFDRYWVEADDTSYHNAAYSLFYRLRRANDKMKLVVMNCPVYYGNENSGSPHVRNLQAKLPEFLASKNIADVMFFDMHKFTEESLGRECFPDLLHPNDRGYGLMATELSGVIPKMMAGEWDYTPELVDEPSGEAPDVLIPNDAVNILGKELDTLYPLANGGYQSWYFGGAPYVYTNLHAFEGYTVTNIEFPVTSAVKGSSFTVSVVKYSHPNVTETLATYTLTADFSCGTSWAKFGGLAIDVPIGYTLAFGKNGDTLPVLYISPATAGYGFYGSAANSVNTTTLAFNVYGIPTEGVTRPEETPKDVTEGSQNVFGRELDREFPIEGYWDWVYSSAPYTYLDLSLFEGRTITDIEIPIGSAPKGGYMTLSVVKLTNGVITETLSSIKLTIDRVCTNEWVLFGGLSLTVPEGYTVAFGSQNDTVKLKYIASTVVGYDFFNRDGSVSTQSCIAFNIWATPAAIADKEVTEGSVSLLPKDVARAFPMPMRGYLDWQYTGTPYAFMTQDYFEGKLITDIEAPVRSAPAGGVMTVSVVKLTNGVVSETLQRYRLTTDRAVQDAWVTFSGLSITVPEGYTLAFGASDDTVKLGFIGVPVSGYEFYGAQNGSINTNAAILFNIYGKDLP